MNRAYPTHTYECLCKNCTAVNLSALVALSIRVELVDVVCSLFWRLP